MSAREFAEWQAFYRLMPFGPDLDDSRFGTIAASLVNPYRGKGERAARPEDFMVSRRIGGEEQTPEQIAALLRVGLAGHRKKDGKGKKA